MKRYLSLKTLLLLALFIISFLALLLPIGDPDFFWHIATGRWIFENRELPSEDPFSYTTPKNIELRDQSILKGYWLSQVLYYSFYLIGGWNGIILLRILIVFLICLFLIKRRDVELNAQLLSVLLAIFVILNLYFLDRPQVFSFLFFAILLYLIDSIRKEEASKVHYISMPLTMVLWANTHPGYILGQLTIFVFLTSEFIKSRFFISRFTLNSKNLRRFYLISFISILAGFLNPLVYKTWLAMLQFAETPYFTEVIIEYSSTIKGFFEFNSYIIALYWILAILAIISIFYRIKKGISEPAEIVLTLILLYFSFTQVRYVAFFIIWAVPFVSYLFVNLFKEGLFKRITFACISLSVVTIAIYMNGVLLKNIVHFKDGKWLGPGYPHELVRFIKKEGLKGNMYNLYDWGGYIIWELSPERKVFIDGRGLHSKLFSAWMVLEQAISEPRIMGKPYWKAILDTYNINYAILPISFKNGLIHPLTINLIYEYDWIPVYIYGNSVLFVRDKPEMRSVIYRYSIPKDTFIDDMINNIAFELQRNESASFYITKGELYLLKNDLLSADISFKNALKLAPFNKIARERIALIEKKIKSKLNSGS
ncbi:MAG: hypothetical protein N2257_04790 [Thermodesulfovibrionales bacterium]|nr:hypothetical protein [Thermodesulfovibrionales bacterium]